MGEIPKLKDLEEINCSYVSPTSAGNFFGAVTPRGSRNVWSIRDCVGQMLTRLRSNGQIWSSGGCRGRIQEDMTMEKSSNEFEMVEDIFCPVVIARDGSTKT